VSSQTVQAGGKNLQDASGLDEGRLLAAQRSIVGRPDAFPGYYQCVAALDASRNPDISKVLLRRLLSISPGHPVGNEAMFIVDTFGGPVDYDRLRRCLVLVPASFLGNLRGGMLVRNSGNLVAAERLAKQAEVIDPTSSHAKALLWKIRSNWGWGGRGVVGTFLVNDRLDEPPRFYQTANAKFFPRRLEEFDDLDAVMRQHVFQDFLPERPLIANDKPIVAMGSCFAQHIRQFLIEHGRLSEHVPIPEGLNNTFAIRQFVDWVEGRDDLVYSYEKSDAGMRRWDVDKDRRAFREAMARAGGFIVTVGVAEVWRDRQTGGVYWRGVPADEFDPARHEHVLSTVEQNVENLRAVAAGLRRLAGDVPVVLTLSPVPLIATMRQGTSIVAADAVSKSILRVAIETVVQEGGESLRYWPSFEAFRWLGGHLDTRVYDGEDNPRHPNTAMIGRIIQLFVEHFFEAPRPAA